MDAPSLALAQSITLASVLIVLIGRGLVSPRQTSGALGGLALGAVLSSVWMGGGHG